MCANKGQSVLSRRFFPILFAASPIICALDKQNRLLRRLDKSPDGSFIFLCVRIRCRHVKAIRDF